jgi:Asp-tRNA(Asn)/Glu-tRNA(Gln) amidotransferase A subunit family amidase
MCLAAIGSQTGGSILRPAAFCGIVGFKPEFGSVPLTGVVPVSSTLDHLGPLTRCVDDAKRLFEVMSDQALPTINLPQIRFGLVREFFFEKARPAAADFIEAQVTRLASELGSLAVMPSPVAIADMHRVHRLIMAVECAQQHRTALQTQRELFGPAVTSLIEEGMQVSPSDYQAARLRAREYTQAWQTQFESVDVLAMPTTSGPAPATLKTTGDPRWQSPWSLCGFPAITLPCGLSPEGMPLGLQLVSHSNELLLAIAAAVEARLAFTYTPTFRFDSGLDEP